MVFARGTNEGESDSFDIEIHGLYKRGQFGDTFYYGSKIYRVFLKGKTHGQTEQNHWGTLV
jgi:hypothetical protein